MQTIITIIVVAVAFIWAGFKLYNSLWIKRKKTKDSACDKTSGSGCSGCNEVDCGLRDLMKK